MIISPNTPTFTLSQRARAVSPYAPPAPPTAGPPIDLHLDANEGPCPLIDLALLASRLSPEAARRYPSAARLELALAQRLGVAPDRVIVTAGGDDAIDRLCRAILEPGREILLPSPTFEMIARSASLAGAFIIRIPWPRGPFPCTEVAQALSPRTGLFAIVSPNNPTGAVATASDLVSLSQRAGNALILLDAAYTEFADEDLTPAALHLPNVVVVRTFSKAFGLAGLRVGYAIGPAPVIRAMRSVGGPYPVSALSLAAAIESLQHAEPSLTRVIAQVRCERTSLLRLLSDLGARPLPSQANFVLAEFDDAETVWRSLAAQGIAVRRFAPGQALDHALRITCPTDPVSFARLCAALQATSPSPTAKDNP